MMDTRGSVRSLRRLRVAEGRAVAVFALLLVPFVLILAGCGGGSVSPSVASLGTTTSPAATTTDANAATSGAGPGGAVAGSGGANSVGLTMTGGSVAVLMRYSSCMRANGVPSFPDPNGQGQIQVSGIDPSSAQFEKAQQACQKDLPNKGEPSPAQQQQVRAQAIAMSDCMRAHGVANFPDPKFANGGASIKLSAGPGGIDPNSPQFQNAQKVCMPADKQGGALPSTVGRG
jgi:hypothetical protein